MEAGVYDGDAGEPRSRQMNFARICLLGILTSFAALQAFAAPQPASLASPGAHTKVRFSEYPSNVAAPEVISRMLSPLAVEEIRRKLQASGKVLQPGMFDIKGEEFIVYVPRYKPAAGYGLLIFIPPWPGAEVPEGWRAVLDHYGVIFVSAARSGNDAEILERRIPLALAGLANVQRIFTIDPTRTLIGGFSGGSRVAMRMALAYPDLFSGLLLNAGSDPIAESPDHLPSPNLFLTFQTQMKVAFVTGDQDEANQLKDGSSQASMLHWCISNVHVLGERGVAHEVASAAALGRAFEVLLSNVSKGTDRLAGCRSARRQEVSSAISRVQRAVDGGDRPLARRMLFDLDGKYGGLAAPQSIELAGRCNCGIFDNSPMRTAP